MRWPRRGRPPGAVRARVGSERVLAWATTADGGTVVATRRGLWLPAGTEVGDADPLPWHLIDKATWSDGVLSIVAAVEVGDGVLEELAPTRPRLAQPGGIPAAVRERVTGSIGYSRYHDLPPTGGVRVVGRRVVGQDGLTWYLVFDPGTDRTDPVISAAAAGLREEARSATGL